MTSRTSLLGFFFLAYGLTWACWLPLGFAWAVGVALPVSEDWLATLGQFGPFVAAAVFAALDVRHGGCIVERCPTLAREEDIMADIVIKRCPVCPSIRERAQEVVAALDRDLGFEARIQDGAEGEFSVLVNGVPVIQRGGDSLPSSEEVEAAVRNAAPAPMGV